jgi:hypothetical protein
LLDGNRKVVGNVADAAMDFGRGQIWNFEAGIVNDEAVASAQVKEINGWFVGALPHSTAGRHCVFGTIHSESTGGLPL